MSIVSAPFPQLFPAIDCRKQQVGKRDAKNLRAGNGGEDMASDLNVQCFLDILGPWTQDYGGRLLPGDEKIPVTELVEKDVKVPVQVGGEEACSH